MIIQNSINRQTFFQMAKLGVKNYLLSPYTYEQLKMELLNIFSKKLLATHSLAEILNKKVAA